MNSEAADGSLEINFYPLNVSHIDFYSKIRRKLDKLPYTYAVIALENIDLAVNCAMQLEELFAEREIRYSHCLCENGYRPPPCWIHLQ